MERVLRYEKFNSFENCIHGTSAKNNLFHFDFSLALHTGEDAQSIVFNREKFLEMIGAEKNFNIVLANQTHSDNIIIINKNQTMGWSSQDDAIADCDALITAQKDILVGMLTADCVPILLFDDVKGVAAAVHAGWKGTHKKIAYKTVMKMKEVFECNDIYAVIAPSIGACCYEVGSELIENFNDYPQAIKHINGKYYLDLPLINKLQLESAGVRFENIEMSNICTSCNNEHFFSYRKEQGCSGRFLSVIGIKS
ncbi:MAG: peptidoglycan editing factor PgeF [Sulfurovaceae bacterium]|nr:peptidoglycan editing factor PgeF [Sulfurovaceae bacterium]